MSTARQTCGTCGWPRTSRRCEACGSEEGLAVAAEKNLDRWAPIGDDDATRAWQAGDFVALLRACVAAEGGELVGSGDAVPGKGRWVVLGGASLWATMDEAQRLIRIEAPIARLDERQRVPTLRAALELCDRPRLAARVCLRGDLLIALHAARLEALPPTAMRLALRGVAAHAQRWGELLRATFDARPATVDRRSPGPRTLGSPRGLSLLRPPVDPSAEAEQLLPRSGLESIPPVLAPALAARAPARGRTDPLVAEAPASVAPMTPMPNTSASPRATLHEIEVEPGALGQRPAPPPPVDAPAPREQLCEMLREAQGLAASLSMHQQPGAAMLLVRAAVFRAVFQFGESVPHAVAHFYRATQGAMRDVQSSRRSGAHLQAVAPGDPGPTTRAGSDSRIAISEPALLVMEKIIRQRAEVPEERPLAVEPLTTAAAAKAHLARYLDQIERAPDDPPLKHFLAMGALSELLARTKLPAATSTRLRDILAHAQRDGAKANALLMRTIAKIAGA